MGDTFSKQVVESSSTEYDEKINKDTINEIQTAIKKQITTNIGNQEKHKKEQNTDDEKKQYKIGMVLNMSMGLGKTRTILSFLNKRETEIRIADDAREIERETEIEKNEREKKRGIPTPVYVYAPSKGIVKGFETDWEAVKKAENDEKRNIIISPFFKEFKDFKDFIDTPRRGQQIILVFDEVHLVQSNFRKFGEFGNIGDFLNRLRALQSVKEVYGLTGTILSDSFSDFLVTMNVVMPATIAPSLNEAEFQRMFFKVPWSRFLQAWIEPIMSTRFVGMLSVYYLVDVVDFYKSGTGLEKPTDYLIKKAKVVQNILRIIPGFETKVFKYDVMETLKSKNILVILSFLLYRIFMSPFNFVVPSILVALRAQSRNDIARPNTKKLRDKFGDYISRSIVEYEPDHLASFKWNDDIRYTPILKFSKIYPKVLVRRRAVKYNAVQAEMFVRFTLGRLTLEEYTSLSKLSKNPEESKKEEEIKEDEEESKKEEEIKNEASKIKYEFDTEQDASNPKYLEKIGLNIGNYCQRELLQSLPKYKFVVKTIKNFEKPSIQDISNKNTTNLPNNEKLPKSVNQQENAISQVNVDTQLETTKPVTIRVVLYSLFDSITKMFAQEILKETTDDGKFVVTVFTTKNKSKPEIESNLNRYNNEGTNPKNIHVLQLGVLDYIGLDGIRNTDLMFILEPLSSYGNLQQLRARVARKSSHDNPSQALVTIYELYCTTGWRTAVKRFEETLKNQSNDVFITLQNKLFSQSLTPDQLILKQQINKQSFVEAFEL